MFLCELVAGPVFKVRCLAEVIVAADRLDVVWGRASGCPKVGCGPADPSTQGYRLDIVLKV